MAAARKRPPAGLAASGVVAGSCEWFHHSPTRDELDGALRRAQNPPHCASARYMLLDDFNEQTGLGKRFHSLSVGIGA